MMSRRLLYKMTVFLSLSFSLQVILMYSQTVSLLFLYAQSLPGRVTQTETTKSIDVLSADGSSVDTSDRYLRRRGLDCGCPETCNAIALFNKDATVPGLTCQRRIQFLMNKYELNEKEACMVASTDREGPNGVCGPECNPNLCQKRPTNAQKLNTKPVQAQAKEEVSLIQLETRLQIVQKAPVIDLSYVNVSKNGQNHPHMGARDQNLEWGYVHDVTRLRQNPPVLSWTGFSLEKECQLKGDDDADYMALQRIRVANLPLPKHENKQQHIPTGVKILCTVYTAEPYHDKIPVIRETWGPRCDGFLVGSNRTDPTIDAVDIVHLYEEAYGNMWQKVRSMWAYIYDNYYEQFDWFHMGGDDMWLIVENLRMYLESEEIQTAANGGIKPSLHEWQDQRPKSQVPLYLGLTVAHGAVWTDLINIGGPGES